MKFGPLREVLNAGCGELSEKKFGRKLVDLYKENLMSVFASLVTKKVWLDSEHVLPHELL